jgi:hypothetical protein
MWTIYNGIGEESDDKLLGSYETLEELEAHREELEKIYPHYNLQIYAPFDFVKK